MYFRDRCGSRRLAIREYKVRSESLASEAAARGSPHRAEAMSRKYMLIYERIKENIKKWLEKK